MRDAARQLLAWLTIGCRTLAGFEEQRALDATRSARNKPASAPRQPRGTTASQRSKAGRKGSLMREGLALVLGLAGVILLLVGLIGGGFTFSGSVMPAIKSKLVRVASFSVGGILVLVAIVIALQPTSTGGGQPPTTAAQPPPSASPPAIQPTAPQTQPQQTVAARVWVQNGQVAYGYLDPNASPVAHLPAATTVHLVCTVRGPMVQSLVQPDYNSDLWYWVSEGYYVADAVLDTDPSAAVVPPCQF